MKTTLLALLLSLSAFAGSRYENFEDGEGKIMFVVDKVTNSIDYKQDAEKAVPLLLSRLNQVVEQCNQQITSMQSPKKAEKKSESKKAAVEKASEPEKK